MLIMLIMYILKVILSNINILSNLPYDIIKNILFYNKIIKIFGNKITIKYKININNYVKISRLYSIYYYYTKTCLIPCNKYIHYSCFFCEKLGYNTQYKFNLELK